MSDFRINVNGEPRSVSTASDRPLLWVLREDLALTGAKFGCGAGLCGACTVHLDGRAIRSCQTRVADVGDRAVTTIEGLGRNTLHPVQEAWIKHRVVQCGYCQPGQIMQAAAMLAANPSPSDSEILETMSGNICRCGTYSRIFAAIADLRSSPVSLKA